VIKQHSPSIQEQASSVVSGFNSGKQALLAPPHESSNLDFIDHYSMNFPLIVPNRHSQAGSWSVYEQTVKS
jgi:hypothetical protein